ncbi:MAG: hypothetical protein LBG62_05545 [Candidatus Methanoplasma sp.]|jgi:methanogenesis imperfect marker protein 11|nr:hypothetical protein [Candidatus Methanoplasma sp.]
MSKVLRPSEVEEKYGKMFCKRYLTMVDEGSGAVQIVERCASRGPGEWDVVNRRRAGGALRSIRMEGDTIIMDAEIGEWELSFGPVSREVGGQGLAAVRVEGDSVVTVWRGIAGATVGIGACIPQCADVIEARYPDGFKIGGAHTASVEIVTPKAVRLIIGLDDTDTKEKGASWVTALKMGLSCPAGTFIDHKIIQLNPDVPSKTTNCCASAVSFAAREEEIPAIIEHCRDFIERESCSGGSSMTVFKGLRIPEPLREFGWRAKSVLLSEGDAISAAAESGVQIIAVTGTAGVIGAVAAIGCFDMGGMAAGIPEDFE